MLKSRYVISSLKIKNLEIISNIYFRNNLIIRFLFVLKKIYIYILYINIIDVLFENFKIYWKYFLKKEIISGYKKLTN